MELQEDACTSWYRHGEGYNPRTMKVEGREETGGISEDSKVLLTLFPGLVEKRASPTAIDGYEEITMCKAIVTLQ